MQLSHLRKYWRRFEALAFFNQVMDVFFKFLILFVVLVLGAGLFRLFGDVWRIMAGSNLGRIS